jgi:imidazolonepropionase-like amidohydrolase
MLFIKNGIIYTMAGQVIDSGDIIIDHGKIIYVGEKTKQEITKQDTVIDATGLWVMPGLIDAHCHIGITEEKKGIEGDDCNEATTPITPYLRAIDAINTLDPAFHNAIQAGITSVMVGPGSSNVVGGQFVFMKTHGRDIDKMLVLQPAAMKVSFGENPKAIYKEMNMQPTSRMSIAALLRRELSKAIQYRNRKEKALKNQEDFDEDFELEPWLPVLSRQIPLKAHVHRVDDIFTAIRIANEFNLNMTLDHCSEGHIIANEIKESGFFANIGPDMACRNKLEIKNADFKTSGALAKAGVKVAVISDHPITLIQYLPIYAGLAAKNGLGITEGLKAITINPAIICNVSNRVGSLEVGKDADIAIFTGNPMDVFTETVYTIINGTIVYDRSSNNRN